jgi:hypothetical protein
LSGLAGEKVRLRGDFGYAFVGGRERFSGGRVTSQTIASNRIATTLGMCATSLMGFRLESRVPVVWSRHSESRRVRSRRIGGAILEARIDVICNTCKIPMKELKGHIYHKRRKWKCRKCGRVRMQEQK